MATKKFKTYCRIIDYVEAVDSDLAELIRGTCTDMVLTSLKGKPGITFLMPQDKAFRAKLSELAYSEKPADAIKAGDMINALIIRDVFKSPSDWMAKKDDIPNSLMPSQHVEIDSVSGKEVVFKSGAKAILDESFRDASKKTNLAVWKLTGEIPVTTDKPAKLKYAKSGKKMGGYDVTAQMSQTQRYKIALAVENAYALSQLKKGSGDSLFGGGSSDIYLDYTLSLINYIMNVRKDTSTMYDRVLPLISLDKIDFYLLVEPHKFGGSYLLDDGLISEWWVQKNRYSVNHKDVVKQIEDLLNHGSGALIYTSRAQLLDRINEVRCQLGQFVDGRPRSCVDEIAHVYEKLESDNTIGGMGPVYPAPLIQYYQSEPGLKMIHDDLRYLTYGAFKSLESESFDLGRYNEILNMIGECLFAATPDERSRQQKLLNKNTIKYAISPTEKINEIKVFLYSTMFMYTPMTESDAMGLKQKHSIRRPDPQNIVVFNISKDLYIQHSRLAVGSSANPSVIETLRGLNFDTLDPALKEELKRKLGL